MKLYKSLVAAAMGFILGMILAGVGGLSAETLFYSNSKTENSKKIETYWNETGIGLSDIETMISNVKCRSSAAYYKACLNAIIQNSLTLKLKLSETTGALVDSENSVELEEMTEAQLLAHYQKLNLNIDFNNGIKSLIAKTEPERSAMFAAQMINSFMSIYVDPHTYILPSKYFNQVGSKIERSKYFVGLSYERKAGQLVVQRVAKNSDADLAGIKAKDKIISINGEAVTQLDYGAISKILRNDKVSEFNLEIIRNGEFDKIRLKRSYRLVSHVQYNDLDIDKNVGLITLSKFSRGVCAEVADLLKKKNPTALVLDLRDNPGGQLDEVACMAGLFLGKDKKAYYVEYLDSAEPNEVVLTSEDLIFTGPISVLVNSRSASASETLAGALKDYNRAVIVGRTTFGKGSFQEPEPWVLNPEISLFKTQGRYLLPSRNGTQAVGVKPQVELAKESDEKREREIYYRPLKRSERIYPPLHVRELVKDFDYSGCAKKEKIKGEGDLYLRAAVDVIGCTIDRKNLLAQSVAQSLN